MHVFEIGIHFKSSSTKDNILRKMFWGKKIIFLSKNRKFLEFSKILSETSKIHYIDYENISTVLYTS